MNYYAHTKNNPDGGRAPQSEWEPLFTPFGEDDDQCQRESCAKCERMEPQHGHLNKVAYWTAKFAAEMFPAGSQERESARQWGYLTGLWHDLGKFSEGFQNYLSQASNPHHDEVIEKVDHTTAGAKQSVASSPLGHFIATAIAGHHAGLLDARHESRASLEKRLALTDQKLATPSRELTTGLKGHFKDSYVLDFLDLHAALSWISELASSACSANFCANSDATLLLSGRNTPSVAPFPRHS